MCVVSGDASVILGQHVSPASVSQVLYTPPPRCFTLSPEQSFDTLIGYRTGNGVRMPTVLPTVGRRVPTKTPGLGPLRPSIGNTLGINTLFSVHYRGTSFIRNSAPLGPYSRP